MDKEYMPEPRNSQQSEFVLPKAFYELGAQPAPQPTPDGNAPQGDILLPQFYNMQNFVEEPEYGIIPSIKRGAANTFASLSNLVGQEEWQLEAEKYAAQFPKEIPDIQSVKSLSDLGTFAVESAAENVANMLLLGVGALGGAVAGVGGTAGFVATNLALQAGESKMTVEAEGAEPTLLNVGAPALVNTAIDSLSLLKIAQKANVLGKTMKVMDEAQEVSGLAGRVKKGVETGAFALASEGSTEAIQTYNNMVAAKLATDKEFREAISLSGKDVDELLNAFAAGGLGAAVTAGPAGAVFANKPLSESGTKDPRKAPIQDTEVDSDPVGTDDAQRVTPDEPDIDAPDVDETPVETQAKGNPSEPQEVQDTPFRTVEQLKQDAEILRQYLTAGQGIPKEVVERTFNGNRLPTDEQVAGSELPGAYNPFFKNWWDIPVTRPDGSTDNMFDSTMLGEPTTSTATDFLNTAPPEVAANISNLIETMRQQLMPNADVALVSSKRMGLKKGENGAMAPIQFENKNLYAIGLNPEFYYERAAQKYPDTEMGRQQAWEETYAHMAEVAAHEMGHAVNYEVFGNSETTVKAAVYEEYQGWLDRVSKMTIREFMENRFPNKKAAYMLQQIPREIHNDNFIENAGRYLGWKQSALQYHLSFEEFTADNMARFVEQDKTIRKELKPATKDFWKKVYDGFKRAHEFLGKVLKATPKFAAWVKLARTEAALNVAESMPLASTKIAKDVAEFFGGDISKFKDSLDLPISDGVRFTNQVGNMLDDEKQLEALKEHYRVSTGFSRKIKGKLLTPSQIAERYNIPEAKLYMERVYNYYNTKMKGIGEADAIAKKWMQLPQKQADALGKFIYAVSEKSDTENRRLSKTEMDALRVEHGITDDMFALFTEVEGSFAEILERLERSLVKDVARQYTQNAEAFTNDYLESTDPLQQAAVVASYDIENVNEVLGRLKTIRDQFNQLRNKNYFPRMRFGSYTLTVKRHAIKDGKRTKFVSEFLTFENEREQQQVLKEYEKQYAADRKAGKVTITASKLDDTTRALYGMPQIVIDKIAKTLRDPEYGQGLTPEQERALADISLDLSPGKRYLRHMQKRKNTAGFSTDAMRTYAAYMANASNHLARVEHTPEMVEALSMLKAAEKEYQGTTTDLAELHSYYNDHFKYLLNPENDWAKLRAFGFLWYLGFNVKSALVNTTQLPMVTYPYLAARYGDAASTGSLFKALKDVTAHFTTKKKYTEEEQRLMDRLLEEGVIDESMASDLAGLSEGTSLQRVLPYNKAHRVVNGLNYYGGYMFGIAEKYNRQVTALATFRMHMKKTGNFEESFRASKDAIHKSQFEYAKYNRPEFMRGKKAVFFLFYNYTQQFMYLAFAGGKTKTDRQTAMRMWGMLLIFAGVQGLPFAEYVLSMIDMLGTNAKKFFGMENPKVNVRKDMRELLSSITDNPDIIMNGAGYYMGAGPLKLLEMFGAPVPNLDVSGSLSMGEALPGFRVNDLKGDPDEMAGQLLLNGLGPIPNIAISMWQGVSSSDPDVWKRAEKAMPVFAKSISKATRYAMREGETSRGGALFLPYDGNDPYHSGEIVAQALGFTGTRLSQKRAIYGEQMTTAIYWTERRQLLLERYAYAVKTGDKQFQRETRAAIREFNSSLTNRELRPYRISGRNMRNSLKSKMRVLRLRERGLPTNKRDRWLYKDIEESH